MRWVVGQVRGGGGATRRPPSLAPSKGWTKVLKRAGVWHQLALEASSREQQTSKGQDSGVQAPRKGGDTLVWRLPRLRGWGL